MKHTVELSDDDLRMIVNALRFYEEEFHCGTEKDEAYFPRVIALADRLEAELAR